MNLSNFDLNKWQECPPGKLCQLAKHDRTRKTRNRAFRSGSLLLAIVVLSACGYSWLAGGFSNGSSISSTGEPNYGGIVCSDIRLNANLYIAHQLDEITHKKIEVHIKRCQHCADHIDQLQKGLAVGSLKSSRFIALHNQLWSRTRVE